MSDHPSRADILLSVLGKKLGTDSYSEVLGSGENISHKLRDIDALKSLSAYKSLLISEYIGSRHAESENNPVYVMHKDTFSFITRTRFYTVYKEPFTRLYNFFCNVPVIDMCGIDGIRYACVSIISFANSTVGNPVLLTVGIETEKNQRYYRNIVISCRDDLDTIYEEPRLDSILHKVWSVLLSATHIEYALVCSRSAFGLNTQYTGCITEIMHHTGVKYDLICPKDLAMPIAGSVSSVLEAGLAWFYPYATQNALKEDCERALCLLQDKNTADNRVDIGLLCSIVSEVCAIDKRIVILYDTYTVETLRERYAHENIVKNMLSLVRCYLPFDNFTIMSGNAETLINVFTLKRDKICLGIHVLSANNWLVDTMSSVVDGTSQLANLSVSALRDEIYLSKEKGLGGLLDIVSDEIRFYSDIAASLVWDTLLIIYHICLAEQSKFIRRQNRESRVTCDEESDQSLHDNNLGEDTDVTENLEVDDRDLEGNHEHEARIQYISPVVIYDLTPRSYKLHRNSSRHASGWTMPEHIRRGHFRSVWVGHGDAKHKETRWIPQTIVNEDKDSHALIKRIEL